VLDRLRRWLELLFATYVELVGESRDVVRAHVRILTEQLAAIIADGTRAGELVAADPQVEARAVFDATARFHDPAHAAEWFEPGIDEAFEGVWSIVVRALADPD
jgi:hypothetical protein